LCLEQRPLIEQLFCKERTETPTQFRHHQNSFRLELQMLQRQDIQFLFFTETEAGTAAARRHFDRIRLGERPPVAAESGRRQREAIASWWKGDGAARPHLGKLSMPVLVGNGIADVMVPAEHSFAIAKKAPSAKLLLYPDAGHAFLFQYAEDFCAEVLRFTANINV